THSITMLGHVSTRSVYLDRPATDGLGDECRVLAISALLRELLITAIDLPSEYDAASRAGNLVALMLDEIRAAPDVVLVLPMPRHVKLAVRCRLFMEHPTAQDTIDVWARDVGLSRRSFTRLFRLETGLTFSTWQRRACLLAALPRLSRGERVTTIAFDLGYS